MFLTDVFFLGEMVLVNLIYYLLVVILFDFLTLEIKLYVLTKEASVKTSHFLRYTEEILKCSFNTFCYEEAMVLNASGGIDEWTYVKVIDLLHTVSTTEFISIK